MPMLQHKLTELREQVDALERLEAEGLSQSRDSLTRVIAGMQRSLEELMSRIAARSAGHVAASASARVQNAPGHVRVAPESDDLSSPEGLRPDGGAAESSTNGKRSFEAVFQSEARKAAILEACLDAVITIDASGRAVEFNAAAEAMFGCTREMAFERDLVDLIIPARMRPQAREELERSRANAKDAWSGRRFSSFAMRADKSEFPVEVSVVPIHVSEPPLLTIYVLDATTRRDSQQDVRRYQSRLRSLTAGLLVAEEHERRLLATDLHDGLSQTIALAQIKLSILRASLDPSHAAALVEVQNLIQQANHAARSISFELSPPVLHDLGLEPALQWLVENIKERYGIDIVLEDDGQTKPTDERTRVILFRSIRELLINAAKHAGSRLVQVRLRGGGDHLDVLVEDDGVGMDASIVDVKGFGLLSIHERLSHVGGSMRIESAPGRGTKIHLCAPITKPSTKKAGVQA